MKKKTRLFRLSTMLMLIILGIITCGNEDKPALTGSIFKESIGNPIIVGEKVNLNTSNLDGVGELRIKWQRADSENDKFRDINGARGMRYHPGIEDAGKFLRVEVSRVGYSGVVRSEPREVHSSAVVPPNSIYDVNPELNPVLHYSYTDGLYDYYYYYLGVVSGVPIDSQSTLFYNGQTPISLSFTSEVITQESVEQSDSEAVTRSIVTTISNAHTAHFSETTMVEAKVPFFAKLEQSITLGYDYNNTRQKANGEEYSSTKTYSSFQGWQRSNSQTISFTIGDHDEDSGYYRSTLFSTMDLYATIIRDTMTGEFYYQEDSFAREDSYFVAIEYSTDNHFTPGNVENRAELKSEIIDNLPPVDGKVPADVHIYNYADRTNLNVGEISIPATINEAVFIGNANRVFTMNVVVEDRTRDLTFTFNNMNFTAPLGKYAIDITSTRSHPHDVYIALVWDNTISGAVGVSTTTTSNNGTNAIRISPHNKNLSFAGTGNLTINGGSAQKSLQYTGASGGRGIYTSGTVSFGTYGTININGGNGGDGGDMEIDSRYNNSTGYAGGWGGIGIAAEGISFYNARGDITIRGGNGGKGGDQPNGGYSNGGPGGPGGNAIQTKSIVNSIYMVRPVSLYGGTGGTGGICPHNNGPNGGNGRRGDEGL